MAKEEIFATIAETLRRLFGERLVSVKVFGSYAAGEETRNSDVDILVVLEAAPEGTVEAAARARAALEVPVPVDVLARTRDQLAERLALGDDFFGAIEPDGLEILGAAGPGMA
jgi:predicted nucleotidyltransferase